MQKFLVIASLLFVLTLGVKAQGKTEFNSYKEMVVTAKTEIELISITYFHKMYTDVLGGVGKEFILIDIRTESEYADGFIPGAFLVQRGVLESRMEKDAVWEAFNYTKPLKSDTINSLLPKWWSLGTGS